MVRRRNVRPPVGPITELDAREAIAKSLLKICAAQGPKKVGLTVGADEKTVRNARDEKSTLRIDTASNLILLDPLALEPLLALFRRRSVPIDAICNTDDCSLPLAALLHAIIAMERDDSDGGKAKTRRELKPHHALLRQVYELTGSLLVALEDPSITIIAEGEGQVRG